MPVIEYTTDQPITQRRHKKRRKLIAVSILLLLLMGLTFTSVSRFFWNPETDTTTDPRSDAAVSVIETEDDASRSAQLKRIVSLENSLESLGEIVTSIQNNIDSSEPLPPTNTDVPPESISNNLYNAYENLEYYNHLNTPGTTSILTRGQITNEFLVKATKLTDLSDVTDTNLTTNDVLKWDGTNWVPSDDIDNNTTYSGRNGVELENGYFQLGGKLEKDTTIDLEGHTFTFTDGTVTVANRINGGSIYQNGNQVCDTSGNCPGGGGASTWYLTGDSGATQTISDTNTVTISGGSGLTSVASATDTLTLNIGAGSGISVGANDVSVDQSFAFAWTGAQSWSNSADFNGDLNFADTDIVFDGASTNFSTTGNFSINTNDLFVQKSDGNVGIGTTSPAYALDVNGMINAVNGFHTTDDYYIGAVGLTDTASNTTSGAYLVGVFDEFVNSNSTTVQGVLADLDAAVGGGGHSPVTLSGPYDYLTLNVQDIVLGQINLTTDVTAILPLANGGTNADLSGVSTGGIIYKGATALQGTGSLTGVLKGNGSSAPTAMTGTQNYVTRWTDANSLGTGVLYDNGTNVGIGTTTPGAKLDVVGGSVRADGDLIAGDLILGYDDVTAAITTSDTDENLTIDPNGAGTLFLHGATYYIDANGLIYTAGLATDGYTPTAGELRADIFRDGNSSYYLQPADTGIAAVLAGNVGIGTTSPDFALQVNGTIAPEVSDQDLGTSALRWNIFANTLNVDSTVTLSGLGTGTDNTVLILDASNQVTTDEIDSRVWGATLVDGSGTTGYVSYWSDANTLAAEQYLSVARGGLGNDVTPATGGEILYSTGGSAYESLPAGTLGHVLVSGGTGAPSWIDSGALGTSYWQKVAGVLAPALGEPIAATSSATTVATFTSNGSNLSLQTGGPSAFARFDSSGNLLFTNASGSTIDATAGLTIGGTTQTGLILGRTGISTRIANLSTDGVVYTSGSNGTLNTEAQLAITRGGTNTTATPTAGTVAYGNGTAYAFTSVGTAGQPLLSNGSGAPNWGTLGLTYGGTNADLSGIATGSIIFKDASSLAGSGALTGVLKGNGASAPTAMTGTQNYVTRWTDANTLGIGILYDNGTNVGIGTTSPDFALQVNGAIAPETTDEDLGSNLLRWNVFANTLNADSTVTLTGLSSGADDTILILNASNQVETREIDPGVWTGDLIAGTGTANYVAYWNGPDSLTSEQYLSVVRGGLGSNMTAAGAGEIVYSTGATTYDSLAAGNLGYVLSSGGAGAPTWVDPASLGTNYWQVVNGAYSPISPYTNNADLLIGSNASNSAKFAVLNVYPGTSGSPTASVSSGLNGTSLFMTADGTFATTNRSNLTIGNSSAYDTTGDVYVNPNGTGNVGIGTTATATKLAVQGNIAAMGTNTLVAVGDAYTAGNYGYVSWDSVSDLLILGTETGGSTMTLTEAGNVGIGTTIPSSFKLQVAGNVGPNANDSYDLGSDALRWKDLYLGGETIHLGDSTTDEGTISYTSANILSFDTDSTTNGDIAFFTDDLYLDKSTGNVGIGTTNPASFKLQIAGSVGPQANDTYDLGSDNLRWRDLFLGGETIHLGANTTDEGVISYNTSSNIFGFSTDSTSNGDIAFFTDDLYLDKSAGNVGIGTTTPAQALHVVGDVRVSGLTASLPVKTNANKDLISGAINLASAEVTGILGLSNGGTNADLSGVSNGGIIYKGASSLEGSGSLTGVLRGNGSSAPDAMTGTQNYVTRWTDANSLGTGVLYDNGTNVGISTTNPASFKLEVAGSVGPTANNTYDLGSDVARWANIYATNMFQNGNAVCDVSGNCAAVGNIWQYGNGAISPNTPYTNNSDLLVGSNATASAKFAVLNIFPGTAGSPTASVSSGLSGTAMFMTADGSLSTQNRMSLTIGNKSGNDTTGNVLINSNGTGNVGIGTTGPTSKLDIGAGSIEIDNGYFLAARRNSGSALINILGINSGTDTIGMTVPTSTPGALAFNMINTGATSLLAVTGDGNVGIGTTNPSAFKLQVDGSIGPQTDDTYDLGSNTNRWRDVYIGADSLHIGTSTTDEGVISYNTSTNVLGISTDSTTNGDIAFFTDDLYLDKSTGSVGIGTTVPASMFSVGSASQFQVNSSGNIVNIGSVAHSISNSSGNLLINANSTAHVLLNTNGGNVGVGPTTSPNARLHVYGSGAEGTPTLRVESDNGGANPQMIVENNDASGQVVMRAYGSGFGGSTYGFSNASLTSIFSNNKLAFGTTTANDIGFITDGARQMTLSSGGNLGIGTTNPSAFRLQVDGNIGPQTTDQDLGSSSVRWDLFANTINADNTVTFSSLGAGATDTVVTHASGVLQTRTIDSRVWGSSLIDGSGTTNYVARWTDADTLGIGMIYDTGTNVGIGTTTPNIVGGGGIVEIVNNAAATNTALTTLNLTRSTTGTAANGIGARLEYNIEDAGGTVQEAATINAILSDVTAGSIDSALTFNTRVNSGAFTEHMRIDATGNVGIGTSSPNALLDLENSVQLSNRILLSGQEYYQAANTSTSGIAVRLGVNRTNNRQVWFADSAAAINTTNAAFRILTGSTYASIGGVSTDGTAMRDLALNAATGLGNVGIGTTVPNQKFQVYDSVDGDVSMSISNNYYNAASTDDTASLRFQFLYQNAAGLFDGAVISAIKRDTWQFAGNNDSDLAFSTKLDNSLTEKMRIQANGNVGIGTSTPSTRFHVDATTTAFDAAEGLAIFQDNSDRQIVIGGLGLFRRDANSNADLRINYLGYNGGTTQFRDLVIYDGKSNQTAIFDGSSGYLGVGTTTPGSTIDAGSTTTSTGYWLDGKAAVTGESADNWLRLNQSLSWTNGVYTPGNLRVDGAINLDNVFDIEYSGTTHILNVSSGHTTASSIRLLDSDATVMGSLYGDTNGDNFGLLDGDSNWAIRSVLDTSIDFLVNNAQRMTLLSSGNLGINSTAPSSELQVGGTTPEIRIGDDGAEDTSLAFMGNAQDYYMGLDDSNDSLTFGVGTAVGTTPTMTLSSTNNVGIGTTTITSGYRLQVNAANNTSGAVARFVHTGGDANNDGIHIQAGENSGYSRYIEFADGDGTVNGYIDGLLGTVAYNAFTGAHEAILSAADNNNGGFKYGTIVCSTAVITPDNSTQPTYIAEQCKNPYQANVLGAYATKIPTEANKHTIFAVGDGHVLVTAENGEIKNGDSIVVSSYAGYGMKAVKPGIIIATATGNWSDVTQKTTVTLPDGRRVVAGLMPVYYYPGVFYPGVNSSFSSEGELVLNNDNGNYVVTASNADPVSAITAATQAVVGRITAGLINTRELVVTQTASIANLSVTNLTVSGQSINDYIRSIVQTELQSQPTPLPPDAIAQNFNSGMVINNYNTTVTIVQDQNATSSTTFSATGSGEIANYFNVTEVTEVKTDERFNILATLISWSDAAIDGVRTLFINAPTTFRYLAWFQGPVKVNADTSGILMIPANTMKARVSFSQPFPEIPTIYVNFSESSAVGYTITDTNQSGFTINFSVAPDKDLSLQWLALLRGETDNGPSLEVMETSSGAPAILPLPTPSPTPASTPSLLDPTPSPASDSGSTPQPETSLSDLVNGSDASNSATPSGDASPSAQTP